MFRIRIRKIISDVWARKGRTFLVSLAIFIGVAGTIALFSLSDIIVGQLRADLKEDELSMLNVFVTVNAGTELDNEAYLEALRNVPGVTEVMGTAGNNSFAQFKISEGDEEFEDGVLNAYTAPYEPALPIEPMRLLEGRYPIEGTKEVVVEQRFAEDYGVAVGDSVYFRILSPSKDTGEVGTVEAWAITGIVFHPYAQSPDSSLYAASVADANYVGGSTGLSSFSARFVDFQTAEAQQETFASLIATETPYTPVFKLVQDPAQHQLIQTAQQIAGTMSFLAMIALVVSGFLVVNVISSIVVEQKRQIGVMKAIGATRWDNFFIYAGIAFAYGLIGVIPGVIIGVPGGNAASHALAPTLNTVLKGFQISPSSILVGILVGLLVPVLAAMIPVYFGTRVKILDAMVDLGIDAKYGSGPLARLIGVLPIPITIRQGLSNVTLKKSRVAFTVITLSIAAGAFMGIFSVFSSFSSGINAFLDTFNVEVAVSPTEGRDPEEFTAVLRDNFQTTENNALKSIEPGMTLQVEFEGYAPRPAVGGPPGILAYGFAVESESPAFLMTVTEGESLSPENAEDGVVLSSLLSTNLGKSVGDKVVMKLPGNSVELNVVGIADFPIEQLWMDWRTLAKAGGYTLGAPRPNEYFTTVTVNGFTGSQAGNVAALGLDTQFAGFIPFVSGEFFTEGESGIVISKAMADQGSYSVGDMLTLNATTDNGSSAEYPIVGIFELPPIMQREEIPPDLIGIFWQDLAVLEGISLDGTPLPQSYFLVSNLENPTVRELDNLLDDINETLLNRGIPVSTFNFVELTEQITQGFLIFQVILQMVALLIALVGALGLLTTLSMSVFERQKEIGVMRSIGASSSTVATQFLTEGLVVGMIAWLLGLPLAYLIEVGLLEATRLSETFPATFPLTAAIIGLVGMLIITTVASLWPSIIAARKTVSDILRYQ